MIDTIIKLDKAINKVLKDNRVNNNLEDLKSYLSVDPVLTTTETGSLTIRISLDFVKDNERIPVLSHTVLYEKPTTTDPCMEIDVLANKFFDNVINWLINSKEDFDKIVNNTYTKEVE